METRCISSQQPMVSIKTTGSIRPKTLKNPLLKEKYQACPDADLKKRYVVEVHDANSLIDNVSFLPHHPVTNEKKPEKVRRVAMASNIFQGQPSTLMY